MRPGEASRARTGPPAPRRGCPARRAAARMTGGGCRPSRRSQHAPRVDRPPPSYSCLWPLHEEAVGETVDELAAEGDGLYPGDALYVDEPDPQQLADQKERDGEACPSREDR